MELPQCANDGIEVHSQSCERIEAIEMASVPSFHGRIKVTDDVGIALELCPPREEEIHPRRLSTLCLVRFFGQIWDVE
jgi:hypothetical protein